MKSRSAHWRLFVTADHPELLDCSRRLCLLLAETGLPSVEVLRMDAARGTTDPHDRPSPREFREGDVLVLLAREDTDELSDRFARTTATRAEERGVILIPMLPRGHGAHPRSAWRRKLAEDHAAVHVSYDTAVEQLPRVVLGAVLPRITLGLAEGADLGQELVLAATDQTETTDAVPSELDRAAQALRGRLFPAALDSLRRAADAHAHDPLPPYWSARLRLAANRRPDFSHAILEATRAARLAALEGSDFRLERAAWMLAVRAAIGLGDESAAIEYLGEAMSGTLTASDWLEVARRHAEMNRVDRTLAALEEAFYLDASILATAEADPGFAFLANDLLRLEQDLRERLRFQVSPLIESELALLQRLADGNEHLAELARTRASISNEEQVERLVAMGQESAHRQVRLLNEWAEELSRDAVQHRQLKVRLELYPPVHREPPVRSSLEDWLYRWWPPFARRWDSLRETLESQERERRHLESECRDLAAQLQSGLGEFLQAVDRFENAALADPIFAPVSDAATQAIEELILHPAPGRTHSELVVDAEIIPDLLVPFAPARSSGNEGCRLYRLEAHNNGIGASRAGVYFQQAWKSLRSA